jgi:glucose/arabinose dehydrogenase
MTAAATPGTRSKFAHWGEGEMPTVPPGLQIRALAKDLQHPRSVYALPNGDVLVVEANGPKAPINRPKDLIMGWVQSFGGAKAKGGNRITLLRGANGDGKPGLRTVFLEHLHSPFGVALVGQNLYVANTDAIIRYPYTDGQTTITAKGNSNITENGMEVEYERAAIWEVDIKSGAHRIFASGLRNPTGLQWEPQSGKLWAVANERDELGPDLVPDYLTSVQDGAFYGWPYSYYGQHLDPRVEPQRPDLVAKAIAPDYALSSHVAPLGLAMYSGVDFPANFRGGAFVGEHGSWDRNPLNGYKVVFVPFKDGKPSGPAEDFVTGFLNADNRARGRPVGLAVDRSGGLLIADDLGNTVWRVSSAPTAVSAKSSP